MMISEIIQMDSIIITNIIDHEHHHGDQVRNEGERVVIGRVVKGGAAERSGNLHPGGQYPSLVNIVNVVNREQ